MTHLPFAIQALIWYFSVGFTVFTILTIVFATYKKGRPEFIWYDLWVGAFWDTKKRLLYVAPLPCFVFIYYFPKRQRGLPDYKHLPPPPPPQDQAPKDYVDGLEEDRHEGK